MIKRVTAMFEAFLWHSRLMVLVAVVAGLAVALASLLYATTEVCHLLSVVAAYTIGGAHDNPAINARILTMIVRSIDGYLLTAILIIFALGLYELFIGRIEAAERSEVAKRVLLIHSLNDLKDRLAKVVVLILVIQFFEHAVELTFKTYLDLLYLAVGIVLVSGAIYLSSKSGNHSADEP